AGATLPAYGRGYGYPSYAYGSSYGYGYRRLIMAAYYPRYRYAGSLSSGLLWIRRLSVSSIPTGCRV
ncbi:MAG: hypothetical protein WCD54_17215, partial [Pseudolabrys sp.]